jgi:hypothetical protein
MIEAKEKTPFVFFKNDILNYLEKENGELIEVVRFYGQKSFIPNAVHDHITLYRMKFPLNESEDKNLGLHLLIDLHFDLNAKSVTMKLTGCHYKEYESRRKKVIAIDKEALFSKEDFNKMESKVTSFFDFLEFNLKEDTLVVETLAFNNKEVYEGRWAYPINIFNVDYTNSELIEKKCIKKVIYNSYNFNSKEKEKLNVILNNEKLFAKVMDNYIKFDYKKVFLEMDAYAEEEWSSCLALNYDF